MLKIGMVAPKNLLPPFSTWIPGSQLLFHLDITKIWVFQTVGLIAESNNRHLETKSGYV
jgi:hypothetical protein